MYKKTTLFRNPTCGEFFIIRRNEVAKRGKLTEKNDGILGCPESDVCGILHEFTKYEKRKTKISEKEETAPSKIRQSKVRKSIV